MRPTPKPPRQAPPPHTVERPHYETLDRIVLAFLAVCLIGGVAIAVYMISGGRP